MKYIRKTFYKRPNRKPKSNIGERYGRYDLFKIIILKFFKQAEKNAE